MVWLLQCFPDLLGIRNLNCGLLDDQVYELCGITGKNAREIGNSYCNFKISHITVEVELR